MANERQLTFNFKVEKGALNSQINLGTLINDMSGEGGGGPGPVDVGSGAAEAIDFGDLTGRKIVIIRNNDGTNYVNYGLSVSGTAGGEPDLPGYLPPHTTAEPAMPVVLILESTAVLWMQADTATCRVQVNAFAW